MTDLNIDHTSLDSGNNTTSDRDICPGCRGSGTQYNKECVSVVCPICHGSGHVTRDGMGRIINPIT